jgi:hypothetical protein
MQVRLCNIAWLGICLLILPGYAPAQPSLSSSQRVGDQTVYRDAIKPNIYYYLPAGYSVVHDTKGKPEFSMLQMRYTGTRATGDDGVAKFNNILQFRVAIDPEHPKKITELRNTLKKTVPGLELRSLPVRKFSSVLVFASSNTSADSLHLLQPSYSEASDENAASNNSFWNDRVVTLRLSNADAQLVEAALKNEQSVMSFSYAIYSSFTETDVKDLEVSGNSKLRKELQDYFSNELKNSADSSRKITMIRADAINLNVDLSAWPTLVQKVDINERMPAKFPLFDVYCYDFNNSMRPDLYAKKIEIKATSVNGNDILTAFSFKGSQPELYAKSIRFPYAVKFDRPFFYRVTEITVDGEAITTDWKEKKDWSELLDITSPPEKAIIKPKDPDQ